MILHAKYHNIMVSIERYVAESRNSMEKMIKALLVLGAIFCVVPAYAACSHNTSETMSGAACSIKELNDLEKNKTVQEKVLTPEREKDLRPVRLNQETPKINGDDCLFGNCLQKTLFGK